MSLARYCLLGGVLLPSACQPATTFDQQVWLQNPEMTDTNNPRRYMAEDVVHRQLRPGMTQQQVLQLLGPPYREELTTLLPDSVSLPKSAATGPNSRMNSIERVAAQEAQFLRAHGRSVRVLLYPVGWSVMDPAFLSVALTPDGLVLKSWVAQH
ncbi:outer membrane protein assembly factor BamE domain-containing protein [Hymenobacter sp. 102]|uniref:outer membrane protein assembly factor BamE domain-containing protein n=1 Tax=Hymenobacter sp. 102 TaxID=3403152 RepID=UPI003CE78A6F